MSDFRKLFLFASCLLASVLLQGCGASVKAAALEDSTLSRTTSGETLYIWASSPDYTDEVLEGCQYWSSLGVECVLVSERTKADVRFVLREFPKGLSTKCVKSAYAIAHANGTVEVDLKLFKTKKGINRKKLVGTLAHETGHELGLDHVSLTCDMPDTRVFVDDKECGGQVPRPVLMPDGSKLCGSSIMNAPRTGDFTTPTENDIRAFSVRDKKWRTTDPPRVSQ